VLFALAAMVLWVFVWALVALVYFLWDAARPRAA
jgi:hypothetical protein